MKTLFNDYSSLQTATNLCIFSHYDPNGRVEPYVLDYLAELKRLDFSVVIVSTSHTLGADDIRALEEVATAAFLRENMGYDFGSYKMGIDFLQKQKSTPKQLLLANDSVYGPFHALDQIFTNAKSYDLYGMTDSFDHHHHLQSFFLVYGERILANQHFWDFWGSVEFIDREAPNFKQQIILRYEVGGSQYFLQRGYSIGSAFPFTEIFTSATNDYIKKLRAAQVSPGSSVSPMNVNFNATHTYWSILLAMGFPFLKRELLLVNPTNSDISNWANVVREISDYDLTKIISAMRSYSGSDDFFFDKSPDTVAKGLDKDGNITLPINPAFRPWQAKFNVPDKRKFRFDENRYLDHCPDVKIALMKGQVTSGLDHFRNNGFREGRPWGLVGVSD